MTTAPKYKGVALELGGDTYIVPPLTLGAIEALHDRIAEFNANAPFGVKQVGTVIDVLHTALRRNYPDITRAAVADMVDTTNMIEVFGAVLGASGFAKADEKNATAMALSGTGVPSTPTLPPVSDGLSSTAAST